MKNNRYYTDSTGHVWLVGGQAAQAPQREFRCYEGRVQERGHDANNVIVWRYVKRGLRASGPALLCPEPRMLQAIIEKAHKVYLHNVEERKKQAYLSASRGE